MRVFLTEHAEENLWQIYRYHADYSESYAESFQAELTDYIFSALSQHPELGAVYNEAINLRRMVYAKRYNIYYVLRDDALYIIYILDGRMLLNVELADPDADLPTIS